jgi:hypothetical protein
LRRQRLSVLKITIGDPDRGFRCSAESEILHNKESMRGFLKCVVFGVFCLQGIFYQQFTSFILTFIRLPDLGFSTVAIATTAVLGFASVRAANKAVSILRQQENNVVALTAKFFLIRTVIASTVLFFCECVALFLPIGWICKGVEDAWIRMGGTIYLPYSDIQVGMVGHCVKRFAIRLLMFAFMALIAVLGNCFWKHKSLESRRAAGGTLGRQWRKFGVRIVFGAGMFLFLIFFDDLMFVRNRAIVVYTVGSNTPANDWESAQVLAMVQHDKEAGVKPENMYLFWYEANGTDARFGMIGQPLQLFPNGTDYRKVARLKGIRRCSMKYGGAELDRALKRLLRQRSTKSMYWRDVNHGNTIEQALPNAGDRWTLSLASGFIFEVGLHPEVHVSIWSDRCQSTTFYQDAYAAGTARLAGVGISNVHNLVILTTSYGRNHVALSRSVVYQDSGNSSIYRVHGGMAFRGLSRAVSEVGGTDKSIDELFAIANAKGDKNMYWFTAICGGDEKASSFLFDLKLPLGDIPKFPLVDDVTLPGLYNGMAVMPNGTLVPLPADLARSWRNQGHLDPLEEGTPVSVLDAITELKRDVRFSAASNETRWGWDEALLGPLSVCVTKHFAYGDKQIKDLHALLPVLQDGVMTSSELCEALVTAAATEQLSTA